MKIGIQTWGSDGDILPFFALANGLRSAGHDVTICYTSIDSTNYSGLSSLVVEHAFDQTFWAQQLNNVGVAEKMLHRRSVTPRKLADAINTILSSPKYNENARKIGTMMRKENGVNTAVQLI